MMLSLRPPGRDDRIMGGGNGLWIRLRFVNLPSVRTAEEAVMQRVGVGGPLGEEPSGMIPGIRGTREMLSGTDQPPSAVVLPVAPLQP
jgi:hypothetical protein